MTKKTRVHKLWEYEELAGKDKWHGAGLEAKRFWKRYWSKWFNRRTKKESLQSE